MLHSYKKQINANQLTGFYMKVKSALHRLILPSLSDQPSNRKPSLEGYYNTKSPKIYLGNSIYSTIHGITFGILIKMIVKWSFTKDKFFEYLYTQYILTASIFCFSIVSVHFQFFFLLTVRESYCYLFL